MNLSESEGIEGLMFPEPENPPKTPTCRHCGNALMVSWNGVTGIYECTDRNACWERFVAKHRADIPQVIRGANDHE
jgi:hypothetical protein